MTKADVEKERINNMYEYERSYYAEEITLIAGVDEVGRGPLAGPVVAAAVILPQSCEILYLNDSKKLSEKRREKLFSEITEKAVSIGLGIVDAEEIDEINIDKATQKAMLIAVSALNITPEVVLIDGNRPPDTGFRQESIISGDAKSMSIAAASVIAKVTRDRMMCEYDDEFSGYNFSKHKGYGTAAHYAAIEEHGISPIHRRSFLKKIK